MANIYRIRVRKMMEQVFRVRADSRLDAEIKAVNHFSTKQPCSQASCEALSTAEDKDQTTPPDIA